MGKTKLNIIKNGNIRNILLIMYSVIIKNLMGQDMYWLMMLAWERRLS